MYDAGKAHQIAKEMQQYKLAILGLCETRLTKSDGDGAPHTEGVRIMIFKSASKSSLEWKVISSKCINTGRFYTKLRKVFVVQCYAPTNEHKKWTFKF